ncbi:hypothetical protein [Streptomyces lavendofoliae]|uniref:Uncharacterized protein n=1 Tax=Streptomyces lavendofoliae TaxID=67314 RepID=A0A918M801_9ACTN|nr:hypothetical protein [Streptomyces lavendofoliae]GGU63212.1 hypothetical protein GCM10010274_59910 [Streptomyces lavendofoliae]
MLKTFRKNRTAASGLVATSLVVTSLTAITGSTAAAERNALPSHQCTVNGVSAPPGDMVRGTARNDTIECENDINNVTVWGAGGNDNIRVKGLIIDSQVLGGDGRDTIQTSHLLPRNGSATVRGNAGDDTLIVATVRGTSDQGAAVYGDMGDDRITVGSVHGTPGEHERGGGQVFGNDGYDRITSGTIDFGGRVVGGSEDDLIEAKAVGPEAGGTIQGGPGEDIVRGTGNTVLSAGPGWGVVDGGLGTDDCKAAHAAPERARSTIANCP